MPKNKHLTLDERASIQTGLRNGLSFKKIGEMLDRDATTISKEVRAHRVIRNLSSYKPCANRDTCTHYQDGCRTCTLKGVGRCAKCIRSCYKDCRDFVPDRCTKPSRPPYVCNGCSKANFCNYERMMYDAKYAQKMYETGLSESRSGISLCEEELKRIDEIIMPLAKRGQSIHHICSTHKDEIMLDERTIYNYVEDGVLSIKNIDLPRKVRYRVRKKKRTVRVDHRCHIGRTYEDYLCYMRENPDTAVVQMDTVEGKKGGKVILTLFFENCNLMLAYIRDCNTARSVAEVFGRLYESLGHERFCRLFPVILTDRGSEFTDPVSIEFAPDGVRRTRVFYCNPRQSQQKGGCEVAHEMIRRVVPKGTPFEPYDQEDISLMMNHINSYTRKKLNDRTAIQLFSFLHGEEVMDLLGMQMIPAKEINLTPGLLNR